jgi:RNA polymerase sigma-70 factor (ECF subfamily)
LRIAPHPEPSEESAGDDELMQRARGGDRGAYASLVRRHQRSLRAFCARWCGSESAGDDVAQECFVELWQQRESYEPQGKLKQYLFRIAANRCKNQRRRRARELTLVQGEPVAGGADGPEQIVARERRHRLGRGLARLPDSQREAILLRYSAELDYREIGELLGAPEPTIRSRVFLGLSKLRKLLRSERLP